MSPTVRSVIDPTVIGGAERLMGMDNIVLFNNDA
jgi:hypothetical protein